MRACERLGIDPSSNLAIPEFAYIPQWLSGLACRRRRLGIYSGTNLAAANMRHWLTRMRGSLVGLAIAWALSAALVLPRIDRGWLRTDDGLMGHTAERVLAGEMPHRDFDDVYTGGLAYVNAAAMRAFGLNLRSPRIVVVIVFLACIPALFYAATRFTSPLGAAMATV